MEPLQCLPPIRSSMAEFCSKDFRDAYTVERGVESSDGFGGFTIVWSNHTTGFGLIESVGGDEPETAGRLEPNESVVITCHYRNDILESDRLDIGGEKFNITRLENVDRRSRFLRIYAETGVRT